MIDLQVNGFKTKEFSCNFWQLNNKDEIVKLNNFLVYQGIEKYLATLISAPYEKILSNLKIISKAKGECLVGVHIEGGLITRLGVHPQANAQEFNLKNIRELVSKFPGLIKLWTFCPSLDPQGDITKFLQDSSIKVSYGHSEADYETAWNAFEKYDVDLVTHWGNAMKVYDGFKQRDTNLEDLENLDTYNEYDKAGIGLAAYRHPKVKLMIIVGSQENHDLHLDKDLVKKLFAHKKKQIIMVSDMVHYASNHAPDHLVGGLSTLKEHVQNAIELGITKAEVEHACKTLGSKILS